MRMRLPALQYFSKLFHKCSPEGVWLGGGGLVCDCDAESYAGGNVATGRAFHAGQVEG